MALPRSILSAKNAQNILVNELDESIIYKDTTFKGNLYVTSLDPEFHLGQGFMPATEYFLTHLCSGLRVILYVRRGCDNAFHNAICAA